MGLEVLYSGKIGRVRVGEKFHGLPWVVVRTRPGSLDGSTVATEVAVEVAVARGCLRYTTIIYPL